MSMTARCLVCLIGLAPVPAFAQEVEVVRDLDAAGRVTLTRDELQLLLPGATMGRTSPRGYAQFWTNDPDGSFIISSDSRDKRKRVATAAGKWHISDDGRYCVLIEWNTMPAEEWCRYILKAGDAFYATRSDKTGTEKVYKLSITR